MAETVGSITIVTGSNHASVRKFRGFNVRVSVAAVVHFRLAAVGGAILWAQDCPVGTTNVIFDGHMETPTGVYVELVSGTFTEGVLLNGD